MPDHEFSTPRPPDDLPPPRRRKGIYVLPNLVTLAALFGGFYAIVMAMNGRFDLATTGVFAAMVLDSLDGRVARMTHTQSAFGEQMDSLSDMVSFGAAPALIAYEWALRPLGRWGWIAAFVYCACAALRLARFNVNTGVVDKRYFQGLPSPAAAALVAGFIWLTSAMLTAHRDVALFRDLISMLGGLPTGRGDLSWLMFAITLFAGLTMVTNVPYYSFKDLGGRRSVPFVVLVLVALAIALVSIEPATLLFALFVGYALSGYVIYGWRRATGQRASIVSTSTDEPEERGLHRD
ncbi:MAG TPA: CDP-diacylglycerol--serine O-phosphatidyltransferase [Ottowia sp.]|nr:CDP-diacylglycerol--serine O-phosphatidyltransferase [Ottowia sp.]HNJ46027.1 CDP-diacylglycerol--serine O-phosphatidyltransferase [Ottowia sp.]HNK52897.1 CDP-diacylglycerol--serine O-phosphatidyltransferase [Ottowia sp.]